MTRKVITALMAKDVEKQFNLIETYITKKQELDTLKKEVDKLSNLVKEEMKNSGLNAVESNGYKVTKIESQRITWKEELLLAKVKTYNKPELIKQVEQVDVPALEQAIIDETIKLEDLLDCQQTTEVISLRLSKVKEKQDDELRSTK